MTDDDLRWPPTPGMDRALRKLRAGYGKEPRRCLHGRLLALVCRQCELEPSDAPR